MLKLIFAALWGCVVLLLSMGGTSYFLHTKSKLEATKADGAIETIKTKELNIPKIVDGAVQGYLVTQFLILVNVEQTTKMQAHVDALVVDEALRLIYADGTLDLKNPRTYGLEVFTKKIIHSVNKRLGRNIVADIAIQEFTFVPNKEASVKNGAAPPLQ